MISKLRHYVHGDLATTLRRSEGVTILELMVGMAILGIALSGIYGFVATGAESARTTNDFIQNQAQVRAALDAVVDETRWAQAVTAASATSVTLLVPQSTPFSGTGPYFVTFAYDAAADTVTRAEDPDAGGPGIMGAPVPVSYSVVQRDGSNGLGFEYFNGDGASLGSSPPDLTVIARVRLTVSTTRDRVSRTFSGDAALRAR